MTALQILNSALEMDEMDSLDEIEQTRNKVHALGNVVTSELAVRGYREAMQHLTNLIDYKQSVYGDIGLQIGEVKP
jgi:CheY-specific phosphatase CheX